jgi:sulfur-oxidizing protein SoxY
MYMNVDMKRRLFLQHSMAASAMGMLIGAGLLTPKAVLAAWPKEAFKATNMSDGLKGLLGSDQMEPSAEIKLTAPEIAENGAVVSIKIETSLANVESMTIVAINNPLPLIANFKPGVGADPFVATRIKMGKTGDVIAVVKADGKLYSAKSEVKVTVGGCG